MRSASRARVASNLARYFILRKRARRFGDRAWLKSPYEREEVRRAVALMIARPRINLHSGTVARDAGLSRSRFYDLFVGALRETPRHYQETLCFWRSLALLVGRSMTVGDTAHAAGFTEQSNFTRFFIALSGMSPMRYRRTARERGASRRRAS
ncbi:MAG: helix-turn-helix transcriptional regulator [Betaproteobacteria bacterium]|nr:helix-turn-helix transcriptional regulator [Betaproteobacteria bacterium]